MKQLLEKNWKLYTDTGMEIEGHVPGDITADLYAAGKIEDPFYGLNHKELGWILKSDFTYETTFDVSKEVADSEEIFLVFDGVDLFSEISLNGQLIGKTESMFLQYRYPVKELLKETENLLAVKMLSTRQKMDEIDTEDYWGIFNDERLFIRKAQCQFGWDWAPDMPGYGICGPVWLEGKSKHRITKISTKPYNDGSLSVFAELNYDVRPWADRYGRPLEVISDEVLNDKLIYRVSTVAGETLSEENCIVYEQPVNGTKNFANFFIESPELWWPAGYGGQPMYAYSVELIRAGKVLDKQEGRFAFREVSLSQRPVSTERLECKIMVNGMPIFAKGSNWVPMECFTGTMRKEKYEKLLTSAKDGNMNMLRVWGGGIYEDDSFYDICDRLGIMIWQDIMFACADIPEEKPEFIEMMKKEITYQITRLKAHPCIVLWSGGNEKVGSICKQISHGDYFLDALLPGMIRSQDDTRPIVRQSPFGMTELANDCTSGDSHTSSYETALESGVEKYRDFVSESVASFVSECTLMGPASLESYQKVFPEDKMWPMNEYWDDRLSDNPYAAVVMSFAKRQKLFAEKMYGECRSAEDFICKGMTVHSELFRAESEYARSNKGDTWGFMNWMYSDTWPSGSLSLVDYYCEPKQVYYQMKRSYAPLLVTFVQNREKQTVLTVVNDTAEAVSGELEYGVKALDGTVCQSKKVPVSVAENGVWSETVAMDFEKDNTYLYVEGCLNGQQISTVYSHAMWRNCQFVSDYTYDVKEQGDVLAVTLKAGCFAKGIVLKLPNNELYRYSDNYLDLQAGEEKTVYIYGKASAKDLVVTDFAKITRR